MKGLTRISLISIALTLFWLSGTCIGQCFVKEKNAITDELQVFHLEAIPSILYCANKCQRDEHCVLFQYTDTAQTCQGLSSATRGRPNGQNTTNQVYMRTLTGTPHDESDAFCLTTCEEPEAGCQYIGMFSLLNSLTPGTCFESCRTRSNTVYQYYGEEFQGMKCLCGYDSVLPLPGNQCVCPKRGQCENVKMYKYRYGC